MKKIISFFLISLILLQITGCKSNKKENINIVYSIPGNVTKFDPQIAEDEYSFLIAENVFEGLIRLDENNKPYSEICDSYNLSDDGLTYTFHLKSGLKWSDERKLTSKDFKFGIQRTLQKETESTYATLFFAIQNAEKFHSGAVSAEDLGIETPDDQTVIFHLAYANSDFLSLLATPASYPCSEEFFNEMRGKYGLGSDKILTNGAFTLNAVKASHIYLKKNELYVSPDKVKPDGIYVYQNENTADAQANFLNEQRDIILYDGSDSAKFEKIGAHINAFPKSVWGIAFNLNETAAENPDFRKMLYHSLDIDVISRTFSEKYNSASGIILPSTYLGETNYREVSGFNSFDFDLAKSKKYYQEFIKSVEDYMPKIDIIYDQSSDFKDTISRIVYNCQSQFDIYINPSALDPESFNEKIKNSDFQIAFTSITPNTSQALDQLSVFYEKDNMLSLKNKKFDELFNRAVKSSSEEAVEALLNCEKYLIKDITAFIPIAVENNCFITSNNINGFSQTDSERSIDFRPISKNT